jgi:hypothetical protein
VFYLNGHIKTDTEAKNPYITHELPLQDVKVGV